MKLVLPEFPPASKNYRIGESGAMLAVGSLVVELAGEALDNPVLKWVGRAGIGAGLSIIGGAAIQSQIEANTLDYLEQQSPAQRTLH